ncbi:MAG: hypothetical protein A2X94_10965 [Bdellovibrionales bacterium GWB1_55_8]|nr:MAG: hypothetical protein A2X94_10965 [Bdellovibrionales bacterium GWB1_55_8]
MVLEKERKIAILNVFREGAVREESFRFGGVKFHITEHQIGWDYATAEALVARYDGYVDGIVLSGVQKRAVVGNVRWINPNYLKLMRAAVKTPVYLADDIREFFADWTLKRVMKEQPRIFHGKKVLFHSAMISPSLSLLAEAGAEVQGAETLLLTRMPVLLRGMTQLKAFLRLLKSTGRIELFGSNPARNATKQDVQETFATWVRQSDVVVTFVNLLHLMPSFEDFRGKIVIVDSLTPELRERLEEAGAAQLIEFIPAHPELEAVGNKQFSLWTALIDQKRIAEDSTLTFDEYVLKWIQDSDVKPGRLGSSRGLVRRCAFIVHPLSQRDIWKTPGLAFMESAPEKIRKMAEYAAARTPVFYYGRLKGAVSETTGQEVECDIYALAATPKQMLAMDEEDVYEKMIECARLAEKRGASLIGLGAYTKVIGDAGVTVAKRAPIPVTNGNSYSASTTLWAARAMVEKMGLVEMTGTGKRIKGKAMVIGATGSIGRVSSLLVSLVVEELVLVATRPDKLLELREEILELSPTVKVSVTTNPNPDLPTTDLVVTATSNQGGTILDILRVKPGAVICDCSRPLDITPEQAALRPDVLVIESGEVLLPGQLDLNVDIGLPKPTVYACLAETVLLTMEGRFESFSLSKQLSMEKVKEIYRIGVKHGAQLSAIQGPNGVITDDDIMRCRKLALQKLPSWPVQALQPEMQET